MTKELTKELDKERKELEPALNEVIEQTLRESWLLNTLAWIAIALGGFLLNLLLLVIVTGG